MATLKLATPPPLPLLNFKTESTSQLFKPPQHSNSPWRLKPHSSRRLARTTTSIRAAYQVVVEHDDKTTELQVDEDETILSVALDNGLPVPHDCKLGVCMTCPARLLEGKVDQSEGMLSDDVVERGYALMCASYPRSDCRIKIIPEEELLSLQLATAND